MKIEGTITNISNHEIQNYISGFGKEAIFKTEQKGWSITVKLWNGTLLSFTTQELGKPIFNINDEIILSIDKK